MLNSQWLTLASQLAFMHATACTAVLMLLVLLHAISIPDMLSNVNLLVISTLQEVQPRDQRFGFAGETTAVDC